MGESVKQKDVETWEEYAKELEEKKNEENKEDEPLIDPAILAAIL